MGNARPTQLLKGAAAAVLISLIGLFVLLRVTGGQEAWPSLARLHPAILGIGVGLIVVTWVCDSLRMQVLVRTLGGRLPLLAGMRISILGAFASNVTPLNTGGEALQTYLLTSSGITVGQSTAIVATKTLLNAFARLCLGIIIPAWLLLTKAGLPKGVGTAMVIGGSVYFTFFLVAVYLMIRPQAINIIIPPLLNNRLARRLLKPERIERLRNQIATAIREFGESLRFFLRHGRLAIAAVVILCFVGWLVVLLIPVLLLIGFGVQQSYAQVMGTAIIFYLASAYAPTPGSSGAAELGFAVLFSGLVPGGLLAIFVAVWRVLTYYLALAVGGILMAVAAVQRRPKAQE